MSLKGNVNDLRKLSQRVKAFPTTAVADVAERTAPALTREAAAAFDSGSTVYGDDRPLGVNGRRLDLKLTGLTRSTVRFVRVGTIVRCVLGPKYARFLVGKYKVLPMGRMPSRWAKQIAKFVEEVRF